MKKNFHDKINHDYPLVLDWIKRSFAANDGQGSSAYFSRLRHPFSGWSPAYPETTGYLLPTLFDAAEITGDTTCSDLAIDGADWLLEVQRPGGGFPSNFADNPNLSVFNSAQILLGLLRTYEETRAKKYKTAALACRDWLMSGLKNGIWEKHNYVPGYVPAYYTRVIYPLLAAEKSFPAGTTERLCEVLRHFSAKINDNFTVRDWGFFPGKSAHLHTVAYTIRGFLECAVLLNDEALLEKTGKMIRAVYDLKIKNGKTAGSYAADWSGDYTYRCVTGILQMSVIGYRLHSLTQNTFWQTAAEEFLAEAAGAVPHSDPLTYSYALPGSVPLWGKYMPFKYPNWAAKFYIDAAFRYLSV